MASVNLTAQTLPPPSRMVYKCEQQGKIVYSDAPCLGATRIDVTPTQGLDSASGRPRVGDDVRREKHNEQMADALRPLFNETAAQRATRHKRFNLEPTAKTECATLDAQLLKLEAEEKSAHGEALHTIQQQLLTSRTRFRQLRC